MLNLLTIVTVGDFGHLKLLYCDCSIGAAEFQHHVFIFLLALSSQAFFFLFSALAGIIFDKAFLLVLEMLLLKIRF